MKYFCIVFLFFASFASLAFGQAFNDFEVSPHDYYEGVADDPMTRLIVRSEKGEYDFGSETGLPLVKKLLADLDIPESSQVLVFSQTSLQRGLIAPENPRAMYFNEDTHLAWMPGGKVEIISFDPDKGGMFFLEVPPEGPGEKVTFTSPGRCFGCHGGSATNYLPGPLGRSHFTTDQGRRLAAVQGHETVGHHVPFEQRWGGYFVNGAPSTLAHLGNTFAVRNENREVLIDTVSHRSKSSLEEYFNAEKFPHDDSQIVPLLLFDHQVEGHNMIMEARYRYRHIQYQIEKRGEPESLVFMGAERFYGRLIDYLLFKKEAPLSGHLVERNPEFEADFRRSRKTTGDGLSLKDFHLDGRIMEHRLSYLIQSRSFLESPQGMKNEVYHRLWKILGAETPPEGYEYFDPGEREKIVHILRETHDDLPEVWYESVVSSDSSKD
ncbi:MAG: hypothetical protein AAF491_01565 [Verrucomicrobiota bacterium]